MKDLCDNAGEGDLRGYLVTVETGYKIGAGTSAKVNFVLSGHLGNSGVRRLASEEDTVCMALFVV